MWVNIYILLNLQIMDVVREGWFSEVNALWPGQCMSLKVTETLHQEKSKFQDIMVVKTWVLRFFTYLRLFRFDTLRIVSEFMWWLVKAYVLEHFVLNFFILKNPNVSIYKFIQKYLNLYKNCCMVFWTNVCFMNVLITFQMPIHWIDIYGTFVIICMYKFITLPQCRK